MKTAVVLIQVAGCIACVANAIMLGDWMFAVAAAFLAVSAALTFRRRRRQSAAESAYESTAATLRESSRGRDIAEIRDTRGEAAAVRELRRDHRDLSLTSAVQMIRNL